MEDNKNKKSEYSGKLQLKKTFNAGQIKQSFSHGRSRSVSVEVKKKRTLSSLKTEDNDVNQAVPSSDQSEKSLAVSRTDKSASEKEQKDSSIKEKKEVKEDVNETKLVKKNFSKQFDSKAEQDVKNLEKEKKIKAPKFVKSPKSFENRRQGKLTISQALNDDNEKVRSLAAVKRAREKAKLRNFLIEKGFYEVINFPFTELASKYSLEVDNPLDTNKKNLRIDLKESLISNLLYNERRQKDSIKLYEISDVYSKDLDLKRDAKIGIIASGRQGENYKEFVQKISNNFLNEEFSILNISFEEIPRNTLNTKVKSKIFYTEVLLENIPNDFFINYKFKKKPINFIRYKKVSEYPGSVRDISFSITDIEITDEILNYFDQVSHANLKKVFMFDFYKNYKNNEIKLGYRFIFQSELNTLKDEEINNSIQEIIDPILKKKGVFIPGM